MALAEGWNRLGDGKKARHYYERVVSECVDPGYPGV